MARLWVDDGSLVTVTIDTKTLYGVLGRHITGITEVWRIELEDESKIDIRIVGGPEGIGNEEMETSVTDEDE